MLCDQSHEALICCCITFPACGCWSSKMTSRWRLRSGRALRGVNVIGDVAGTSGAACAMLADTAYDVVVLDAMLPDADGFVTCRQLRSSGEWTPIIMVTARDGVDDRIRGLDAGADDYLSKPFAFGELLARLRALARRDPGERPVIITVGALRLDPASAQVWRGEHEIRLSTREFALLEAFMRSPGQDSQSQPAA